MSLADQPSPPRLDTLPLPSDWPQHYPFHAAFGPRSMVPMPVPPALPHADPSLSVPEDSVPASVPQNRLLTSSSDITDSLSTSQDNTTDSLSTHSDPSPAPVTPYTVREQDRDLSRGMGLHLHWPTQDLLTKSAAPNLTNLPVTVAPLRSSIPPLLPPLFLLLLIAGHVHHHHLP